MARPEFCREAYCPYYQYTCRLEEVLKRNWPTLKLRERERKVLRKLSKDNSQEVIEICETGG